MALFSIKNIHFYLLDGVGLSSERIIINYFGSHGCHGLNSLGVVLKARLGLFAGKIALIKL